MMVAQETHQDGTPHLHVLLQFNTSLDTKDPRFFDPLTGQHGDYEVAKDIKAAILYLRKEDKEPAEYGSRSEGKNGKSSTKSDQVAARIMEGGTLRDIINTFPGYALMNKKKIEDFITLHKSVTMVEDLKPWVEIALDPEKRALGDVTLEDFQIIEWLNTNVRKTRKFKQRQLFVHGPPDHNKTSLVIWLSSFLRIYYAAQEDFLDGYDDESYDLIVFDEFVGSYRLQTMNQILDGSPCRIRVKGAQVFKNKNLPVLILSNLTPQNCYLHNNLLSTFLSRIQVVALQKPICLTNFISQ